DRGVSWGAGGDCVLCAVFGDLRACAGAHAGGFAACGFYDSGCEGGKAFAEVRPLYREPLGRSSRTAAEDGVGLGAADPRGKIRSRQSPGGEHASGAGWTDRETGPDAGRCGEHGAKQDWISAGETAT